MRNRERLIQVRTTETEYKTIELNAKKLNMKIAPFIRMVAQNPTIIQFDYSKVEDHTKEIAAIRREINRLIFTIEASNNYLPRDIESIVNYIEEIFKSENKLIEIISKQETKQYNNSSKNQKNIEVIE